VKGKFIQRSIRSDARTVGAYDPDLILNSVMYDVEFPDGQVKEYAANVIAENMLSQIDHSKG
jgi:hypothetical protein